MVEENNLSGESDISSWDYGERVTSAEQPDGRRRRSDATHRELLRLGIERFPIKGYSATTFADIVEGSGISRGSLHLHFGDKPTFFLAVLRAREERRSEWWTVLDDPGLATLDDAIHAAFGRLRSIDAERQNWLTIIIDFWLEAQREPTHAAALRELYADHYLASMTRFVEELAAHGFIELHRPAAALAHDVFAFTQGVAVHHQIYGPIEYDFVPALIEVYRRG